MSRNNSQIDQIFFRSEAPDPEQLLAYAKGELSPAEARKVEEALADDPFLTDALEGIETTGTEAFEEMMADIDQELDRKLSDQEDSEKEGKEIQFKPAAVSETAPTKKNKSFRLYSIAASIAIIAVVGIFLFKGNGFNPQDYYVDPPNGVIRGDLNSEGAAGLSDDERTYNRGSRLYGEGQFDEASKLFESIPLARAKLMAGHCYLQLENYERAAFYFQEVIDLNGGLKYDGEYNLALTLLSDNKTEEGRKLLQEIAGNKRHTFSVQADEVLKKLD